jgi:15-cis-phytoene synthase
MGGLAPVTRPMRDGEPSEPARGDGDGEPSAASRGLRDGEASSDARGLGDARGVGSPAGPDQPRGANTSGSGATAHDSDNPHGASGLDQAARALGTGGPHIARGRQSAASTESPGDAARPANTGAVGQSDTPRMLSPSRYLAWLYSPEAQQPVLAKLCEIESEMASSLRPDIDHHVAHARLQWWQEECERCAQGRPVHPLTRELVKAYGTAAAGVPSPLAGLRGFVDTAIWDLAGATFETRKELTAYCERWAAAMFETAAGQVVSAGPGDPRAVPPSRVLGAASGELETVTPSRVLGTASGELGAVPRWRALGAAAREIELLADLAREAHTGRVRVPLDELDRAGVVVSSLAKPPWPGPLAALLRARHEALRATIGESVGALGREEQANYRGLLVWAALACRQSARAQRALPGIISPRRYHALADGWQAWRAARRAAAGKLRLS